MKRDDYLKSEIIITYDMIELFKKKYGFSNMELGGIFNEESDLFYSKKSGDVITGLKDPSFVFNMMSDSEKLKKRVSQLYKENSHARKIYHKVFKDEADNIEMICNVKELIEFRKKIKISREDFATLLGVKGCELKALEDGKKNYFVSKSIDLDYYLNNSKVFYDLAFKAFKEGKISKRAMRNISSGLGSLSKESKTKIKYVFKKDVKPASKNKTTQNQNDKYVTNRRLNELRNKSKIEEKRELDGGRVSYTARKELIKVLCTMYEDGEKISKEDIDIVKKSIMYNEDMVSVDAIKLCILGTYRTYGYNQTMIITNRLICELDKKKYGSKLQEFKDFVQESNEKLIKEKLLKEKQNKQSDERN